VEAGPQMVNAPTARPDRAGDRARRNECQLLSGDRTPAAWDGWGDRVPRANRARRRRSSLRAQRGVTRAGNRWRRASDERKDRG
jgi:hypothetical protein